MLRTKLVDVGSTLPGEQEQAERLVGHRARRVSLDVLMDIVDRPGAVAFAAALAVGHLGGDVVRDQAVLFRDIKNLAERLDDDVARVRAFRGVAPFLDACRGQSFRIQFACLVIELGQYAVPGLARLRIQILEAPRRTIVLDEIAEGLLFLRFLRLRLGTPGARARTRRSRPECGTGALRRTRPPGSPGSAARRALTAARG